ncbi:MULTISPECIES: ATP-binding protein [unclassified Bradyrhizobium]|uniref:ATP-binding protein n=1 Tax=unclassified Bradyrhizobium TaxID=2631580 RepID=UPI002915C8BC|nr:MULTISPECIES: AAA family ATPase [unclassified Bradyrhizobium]
MTTVSMAVARRMIIACYRKNVPLMLTGYPGMGKTATYESVARELGIGFIDFRLGLKDPVDVGGMRVPDAKTGKLRHYVPDDLPDAERDGAAGIILFDEINAVAQMMQTTAYGLIQERRIGKWRMPEGWVPMAAGNNVSDRAAAQRMSTALANRFLHADVAPDLEYWVDNYGLANCPDAGISFLRFRPALFHVMPKPDEKAFPSARSWTAAFRFLDEEPTLRRALIAGEVGDAAADELEGFLQIRASAVTLAEILADPKGCRLPPKDKPAVSYAVSGMLANAMTRKTAAPIIEYAGRLGPEYEVLIAHDAQKRDKTIANTSAFGAWAVRNQEVVL